MSTVCVKSLCIGASLVACGMVTLGGAADGELHLQLLAGQAWSLATLNEHGIDPRAVEIPPTIDWQYLSGFAWARQPQFRITQDIDREIWMALSLENPQTTFYTGPNPFPEGVTSCTRRRAQGWDSAVRTRSRSITSRT
jgi:hypothetical protein